MHIPPLSNNPFRSADDEARFQNLRYGLSGAYIEWTQHPFDRASIEKFSNFLKNHKEDFAWAISDRLALPFDVVDDMKVKYKLITGSVNTLLDPSMTDQMKLSAENSIRFTANLLLTELHWI